MKYRPLAAVVFCVGLSATPAAAEFITAPADLANAKGGLGGVVPFSFPQTAGSRSQIVYDAALFGASGKQLITAIQFRPIDPTGGIFGNTLTVSNARLQLSTTPRSDENRNPLSTTFAANIGADVKTVYSGPLTLTTASTLLPNGTRAFDYVITFQTPFEYDPSKGNLLLDSNVPAGASARGNGTFGSFPRFDTTSRLNDGVYSVVNNSSGNATTGIVGTSGPVARFVTTPVSPAPAPASLVLAGSGGALLMLRRSLRRA